MNRKKVIAIFLVLILCSFFFTGCLRQPFHCNNLDCLRLLFNCVDCLPISCSHEPWSHYKHPDFITAYTEEEHIQRITERTQIRFSEKIESGAIVNYTVEIVYAFYDNDPEYFLVNLEYKYPWRSLDVSGNLIYETKYQHFLGYIENDEYYTGLTGYTGEYGDSMFIDGRNAYEVAGCGGAKKYYGSDVFAVETKDGLLQIFDIDNHSDVEFDAFETQWEQRIIPASEYEDLMKNNYKFSSHIY